MRFFILVAGYCAAMLGACPAGAAEVSAERESLLAAIEQVQTLANLKPGQERSLIGLSPDNKPCKLLLESQRRDGGETWSLSVNAYAGNSSSYFGIYSNPSWSTPLLGFKKTTDGLVLDIKGHTGVEIGTSTFDRLTITSSGEYLEFDVHQWEKPFGIWWTLAQVTCRVLPS